VLFAQGWLSLQCWPQHSLLRLPTLTVFRVQRAVGRTAWGTAKITKPTRASRRLLRILNFERYVCVSLVRPNSLNPKMMKIAWGTWPSDVCLSRHCTSKPPHAVQPRCQGLSAASFFHTGPRVPLKPPSVTPFALASLPPSPSSQQSQDLSIVPKNRTTRKPKSTNLDATNTPKRSLIKHCSHAVRPRQPPYAPVHAHPTRAVPAQVGHEALVVCSRQERPHLGQPLVAHTQPPVAAQVPDTSPLVAHSSEEKGV
jgi:hypothetical protein